MNKSQSNSNYYNKNREKILNHAKEYYTTNREKVLDYKKQFYLTKTFKYQAIKNIQLKDFSKKNSKAELKYRIDSNSLIIEIINDNGVTEELHYNLFLEQYTIKDDIVVLESSYDITTEKLYLLIPRFYVLSKNSNF